MSTAIATKSVTGRRQLHFSSVVEILADVEQLTKANELRNLGNWSFGQILNHLAMVMKTSLDGSPTGLPRIVRFFLALFFKNRFLNKPMPPGFKGPKEFMPPPTSTEEGLKFFREMAHRLQTESQRHPSAFLGKLTNDEWTKLHCRHAALHLSFLVPA